MMRHIGSLAIMAALLVSMTARSTYAADCTRAADIGEDIWKAFVPAGVAAGCIASAAATGPLAPGVVSGCLASAVAWGLVQDELIDFWNSKVGSDSSWTIGPRQLVVDDWEQGTLWSSSTRLFVTTTPTNAGSQVKVIETDGKNKVVATICTIKQGGGVSKVKTYTFNDSSSDKNNTNEKISVTLKNDGVVAIDLRGKSVSNKLKYRVKVIPK